MELLVRFEICDVGKATELMVALNIACEGKKKKAIKKSQRSGSILVSSKHLFLELH